MKSPEEIKNRLKEFVLQDGFVFNIFNYCDRWCDKCSSTNKCMNFALSESEPELESTEAWVTLKNIIDSTCQMLDDLKERHGIDPSELDNIEMAIDPGNHPLILFANEVVFRIHKWLEKNDLFERLNNMRVLGNPPTEKFTRYKESIEVIYWYNFFVSVKIIRAVADLIEKSEFGIYDMNGSAKIALVSIDKLIVAWSYILTESAVTEDEVLDILIKLTELRKRTDFTFPDARKFLRPGLDE
jgi:hypothetical protein